MTRTIMTAVGLAAALCAAEASAIELNLAAGVGGAAPITEVLRKAGPGLGLSAELTVGALPFLDAGLRYSFAAFPRDAVDAEGRELGPIYDHGVSGVVSLNIVTGSDGGWLEPPGDMPGRLWLDMGLGYHKIGREDVFGLDSALGYEFAPVDHFSIGPMFRLTADFGTTQGTAAYVSFGLTASYDLGSLFGGEETGATSQSAPSDPDSGPRDEPEPGPPAFAPAVPLAPPGLEDVLPPD